CMPLRSPIRPWTWASGMNISIARNAMTKTLNVIDCSSGIGCAPFVAARNDCSPERGRRRAPIRAKRGRTRPARGRLRLRWRLPQLDAVAFRVHDPAEAAVLALVDLCVDSCAGRPQRGEQRVQVVDAEVDHEGLVARLEILGVFLERCPE